MKFFRPTVVVILVFFLCASISFLLVKTIESSHLQLEVETWSKSAGKSEATVNYQNNDIFFLKLKDVPTVITPPDTATNFSILVKDFPNTGEGASNFVFYFNVQMGRLILKTNR